MDMSVATLGKLWAAVRAARDIHQDDVASAVKVTPEQVSRWENGVHTPRGDNLRKVNRYLKIPAEVADDVLDYDDLPPDVLRRIASLIEAGQRPRVAKVIQQLERERGR
jgi:transcriptional regulator with XRE-family HTH domain